MPSSFSANLRRRAPRAAAAGLGSLILLVTWLSAAAAAAADDPQADAARVGELLRAGRRAEALSLCRDFVRNRPDDPIMLYNLACLENTDGEPDAAREAYRRALAAGFDAYDTAANDPDLQGPLHAAVLALNEAEIARLQDLVTARGFALERDAWSPPRTLSPHGTPGPTADGDGQAALRLQWRSDGLAFEVTAEAAWGRIFGDAERAPWQGGPGLVLALGVPRDDEFLAVETTFLFAFGLEDKGAAGGLFVPGQGYWQRVVELAPKIRVDDDGRLRLTGAVPWSALAPFDPLVDTPLGINATLLEPTAAGVRRTSLVDTADTLVPSAETRRLARLAFDTDSVSGDVLAGRLSTTLSTDRPVEVEIVAVTGTPGEAVLSLDFKDQAGRSVLPAGRVSAPVTLKAGTNRLGRQADFRPLTDGGYLVEAELEFPSGEVATWRATVLQLAPDWDLVYRERIGYVAKAEQATVRYLLDAIAKAAAGLGPWQNPGAIITTLIDLEQMLADAEETGTVLPSKGSFVFVYPGPDGGDRLCRMYLPAGREHADGLNPVLILADGGAPAARLAERVGRNYEYGDRKPTLKTGDDDRFPVYLVPELRVDPLRPHESRLAEARACRAWAMSYFQVPGVSLAGLDALGGTVLQLADTAPQTLRGLLVFAGAGLEPWPQAPAGFLREKLGPAPAGLAVTWLDFPAETHLGGQAPDILAALRDLGYALDVQEVRGGLTLTQAADRVVVWAEDLR